MNAALGVAVIAGGPSSEAQVSRASAAAVASALNESGHRARIFELDRGLPKALTDAAVDVVFPLSHGALGEDGCLQGLLEVLELPYVGSGVLASAAALSKPFAKLVFQAAGLPVAPGRVVASGQDLVTRAGELRRELGGALFVKPASGGSSAGVGRVHAEDDDATLVRALERALALEPTALVEPLLDGAEMTCGVLENGSGDPEALPVTLIVSRAGAFYDFTAKYAPGGSEHRCPAPLPDALARRIQQIAVAAHRALGARDLSRADFVVCEAPERVTLLELNTLPGMTATSLFPEAAHAAGIEFAVLCDRLVRQAQTRPQRGRAAALEIPVLPVR